MKISWGDVVVVALILMFPAGLGLTVWFDDGHWMLLSLLSFLVLYAG